MTKKRKLKVSFHRETISNLVRRLRSPDLHIFQEHEYKNNGDHEADILAINFKRKYAYAIEVKTTNHPKGRKKALWQLEADEKYINERWKINRVFKFYAHKSEHKNGTPYDIKIIPNNKKYIKEDPYRKQ